MGRNTTTPSPQSLDRFSIGEIQDLSGVADLYNAGTSKWMKSNTFVDGASLSSATKASIAALPTASSQILIESTAETFIDQNYHPFTMVQTQPATIGTTTVYPCAFNGSTQFVYVVNNSGAQLVNTGMTCFTWGGQGAEQTIVTNGTTFFQYSRASTTAFQCRTSTDGLTWTSQSLTGMPSTYSMDGNAKIHGAGGGAYRLPYGTFMNSDTVGSYGTFGVYWCGARFLAIGFDSSYYYTSLSTDGLSWGGNQNTTVLGSSTANRSYQLFFYRSGNYCVLMIGTTHYRYSSDGGITWNAMTVTSGANALSASYGITRNQSDPLKFILWNGSSAPRYSADGGVTISGDRPFGVSVPSSIVYVGNTVLVSDSAGAYKSTDNGSTWTAISTWPSGTLGFGGYFLYDGYRYYFVVYGQAQVLTSTDASTWTLRTLTTNTGTTSIKGNFSFDTNVVCIQAQSYLISSTDGGVTWQTAYVSSTPPGSTYSGQNWYTTTNGGGFVNYGSGFSDDNGGAAASFSKASVVAGGSKYKITSSTITPIRTNAYAYVRVE
jgi:photosystem II stability/assembly factor-like uncharacterized protein